MSQEVQQLKARLRTRNRAILASLSPETKATQSEQLRLQLRSHPAWQAARSVLLFWPLAVEPDIRPLIDEALIEPKIVLLPRFLPKTGNYEAARITNTSTDLASGPFGVAEPAAHCPTFDLKQLDFALVPGLGFSIDGSRLGRGKGHYDRLLAEVSGTTCGIAFHEQLSVEVPLEPHDKKLSCILTPTHWHAG